METSRTKTIQEVLHEAFAESTREWQIGGWIEQEISRRMEKGLAVEI